MVKPFLTINMYGNVLNAVFNSLEEAETVMSEINEGIEEIGRYNRDKKSTHKFTSSEDIIFSVTLSQVISMVVEDLEKQVQTRKEAYKQSFKEQKIFHEEMIKAGLEQEYLRAFPLVKPTS